MNYRITVPGILPSLNEYINAERQNKYKAAAMKRKAEQLITIMARTQLKGVKIEKPVRIEYIWVEPNRKRDKDNIAFAKKFIQDALVKCNILKNDGWNEIVGFIDRFDIDKRNPRIDIDIEEM